MSAGYMCTVESFDRRVAGYFSSHLASTGVHPVTANKCLSFLSAYWHWMYRKGLVSGENPWRFQSLPTSKSHRQDGQSGKRAFTDDELSRLLYDGGPPESVLHDFMLIAALSGMRINEIANIKVRDIDAQAMAITIPTAKTKAGIRLVPIHSGLQGIIARRMASKASTTWLFPELPEQSTSRESERYMPLSKRFDRHRRRLGVHERPEGQRQSRVDFHSFRRWFVTKAERANVPPHIIQSVIGHKRGSLTLDGYSDGAALDQLRACVEAVKLPSRAAHYTPTSRRLIEWNPAAKAPSQSGYLEVCHVTDFCDDP